MFEDDNLDDLDIGLEDLPSSRMGRSPFAFPFQGSPSPTAPSSPGVRSPSASPFHGFPSPTAPSSPGTRASSLEVPEARGKGQEEDFGECCSGLSLQVFGVVSRFGVV